MGKEQSPTVFGNAVCSVRLTFLGLATLGIDDRDTGQCFQLFILLGRLFRGHCKVVTGLSGGWMMDVLLVLVRLKLSSGGCD